MAGLALAGAGSLVWCAKMTPMEKERDGRSLGLSWPPFDGVIQQPTERECQQGGGIWGRDSIGVERVGRACKRRLGGRIMRPKNKNRDRGGPFAINGRH